MSGDERDEPVEFVALAPDAGKRVRRAGVNQAPPEELYGYAPPGESKEQGNAPAEPYRATQSAWTPAPAFAQEQEEDTEPLLGNPEDLLLSTTGLLIMYGDGGAGKTTLTLDAMCHLASGTTWLGQPVPTPLRIVLIENEGPRGMLRKRLRAKLETWEGDDWGERVTVFTEPWGRFNFRDSTYRQELAEQVDAFDAHLVMVGPLAAIGAVGGGTPDEVSEFSHLLLDTQERSDRPFAYWVVHHENKAGDVSGAWERLPDTLVHVQGQGNGHTRLHWRKARWSALHDTSMNLTWTGTYSFSLDDPQPTDDDHTTTLRELYETDDQWRTVDEVKVALGIGQARARRLLDELTDGGVLVEVVGPPGRQARSRCWRLASGVDQTTLGDLGTPGDTKSPEVTHHVSGKVDTDLPAPPYPEGVGGGSVGYPTQDSTGDPDTEWDNPLSDDIPF